MDGTLVGGELGRGPGSRVFGCGLRHTGPGLGIGFSDIQCSKLVREVDAFLILPLCENDQLPANVSLRRVMLMMILGRERIIFVRSDFLSAAFAPINAGIRIYSARVMECVVLSVVAFRKVSVVLVVRHF